MKKKIFLICILFFVFCSTEGASADFRSAEWGMTKKQVIATEKKLDIRPSPTSPPSYETLSAKTQINHINCFVFYTFLKDKLLAAGYLFSRETLNNDVFVSDYKKIDTLLFDKYGHPTEQESFFKYEDKKGLSLVIGEGFCFTRWNLPKRNFILHELYEDNSLIIHRVSYSTYENQKIMEETNRERDQSVL